MRFVATLCLSVFIVAAAWAAPLEHDLGKGLAYFRIAESAPGLPPADHKGGAVLDLRYAETSAVSPKDLAAWLQQHATLQTPVFALANVSTAPELRAVLTQLTARTPLLIIGPAAGSFEPDIAIPISADAEHTAYTALQSDTDIATLITPPVDKPRQDEAAIMAARQRGEFQDKEAPPELTDDKNATSGPTVDLALQRAVHLHRAWLILGAKQR